jgi:hypothetical protein
MLRDRLLLVGSAVIVVAAGGGALLLTDELHISSDCVCALFAGIVFFVSVGRGFREKFRSKGFVLFFVIWCAMHVVFAVVLINHVIMLFWLPLIVVELAVGLSIAFWMFGVPLSLKADEGRKEDQRE